MLTRKTAGYHREERRSRRVARDRARPASMRGRCRVPVLASGHDGPHRCGFGDVFAEPANKCLELCPHFDGWCIRDKGHDGVHWCGRHDY